MSRKRLLLSMGGGAVLLAALVATGFGIHAYASGSTPVVTVNATTATNSTTNYCQLFASTLAGKLGVSTATLRADSQAAAETVVNQMYTDGKITAAQKTALDQRIAAGDLAKCGFLGGPHGRGSANAAEKSALAGARGAIEQAVANAAGITAAQLQGDLANHATIATIAGSKLSAVKAAYLSAVQTQLNTAVSNKIITQTQANRIYAMAEKAASNGNYPLLRGPRAGSGVHGPKAPAQSGSSSTAAS